MRGAKYHVPTLKAKCSNTRFIIGQAEGYQESHTPSTSITRLFRLGTISDKLSLQTYWSEIFHT